MEAVERGIIDSPMNEAAGAVTFFLDRRSGHQKRVENLVVPSTRFLQEFK